jgi:hypothetical protein
MANEKISQMTSVANSGTLQAAVIDPNDLTSNKRTTLPALTLSDGSAHTITNASSIVLGSGGTLSGSGGIGTISGFGGGGGGSYTAGLGIAFAGSSPTTINDTGTIVQPAASSLGITLHGGSGGVSGAGGVVSIYSGAAGTDSGSSGYIYINNPNISQPGTPTPVSGGAISLYSGDVTATNTAGTAISGAVSFNAARATNGVATAVGGVFEGAGAYASPDASRGGNVILTAGYGGTGATTNTGGAILMTAGGGAQYGGNVQITPGSGATNGLVLLTAPFPATNPHILGAVFQGGTDAGTGGYFLERSTG